MAGELGVGCGDGVSDGNSVGSGGVGVFVFGGVPVAISGSKGVGVVA